MVNKYTGVSNLSGVSFIPPEQENSALNQYQYYKKRKSSGLVRSAVVQTIGTLAIPLIINTVGRAALGGISSAIGKLAANELDTKVVGTMAKKVSAHVFGEEARITKNVGRRVLNTARHVNYAYQRSGLPSSMFLEAQIQRYIARPYANMSRNIANRTLGGETSFLGRTFIRATEAMAADLPISPYLYYMYMKDTAKANPEEYQKSKGVKGAAKWYVKSLPSRLIFGSVIRGGIGLTSRAINSSSFKSMVQLGKISLGNAAARPLYILNNMSVTNFPKRTGIKSSFETFLYNTLNSVRNANISYENLVSRSDDDPGIKNLIRFMSNKSDLTHDQINAELSSPIFKSFTKAIKLTGVSVGNDLYFHQIPKRTINNAEYDLTRYNIAQANLGELFNKMTSIPLGKRFGLNLSLMDFVGLSSKVSDSLRNNQVNVYRSVKDHIIKLNEAPAPGKTDLDTVYNFLGLKPTVKYHEKEYDTIDFIINKVSGGKTVKSDDMEEFYKIIGRNTVKEMTNNEDIIDQGRALVNFVRTRFTVNRSNAIVRASSNKINTFVKGLEGGYLNILSNEAIVTAGDKTFLFNRGMNLDEGIVRLNPFFIELTSASNLKAYTSNSTTGRALLNLFKRRPGSTVGYMTEEPVEVIDIDKSKNKHGLREFFQIERSSNLSIFQKFNNIFARKQSTYNPDVFFNSLLADESGGDFLRNVKIATQANDPQITKLINNNIQLLHKAFTLEKSKEFVNILRLIEPIPTTTKGVTSSTNEAISYIKNLFIMDSSDITFADLSDRVSKLSSLISTNISDTGHIELNLKGEVDVLSSDISSLLSDAAIKKVALDVGEYRKIGSKSVNFIDYYNSLLFQVLTVPGKFNLGLTEQSTDSISLHSLSKKLISTYLTYNIEKTPGILEKDGINLNPVIDKWKNDDFIESTFKLLEQFNEYQTKVMKGQSVGRIAPAQSKILNNIATTYGAENKTTDSVIANDFLDIIHQYFSYSGKEALKGYKHNINVTVENLAPGAMLVSTKKENQLALDANIVGMTIASHVNNTLSELGIGFPKNFTSPLDFYARLITKRIIPGAIGVAGLSLADAFFRSTPFLNGTPLGGGISGMAMDIYANTKIASYALLDMLGVTDAAYNLEEKYPGIINSPMSGLVRGIGPVVAGLRYGGLPGAAVGLGAGVVFGGGPLGIMDDWDITKSRDDIIAEFTGEKEVPVKRGRWWMLSFSPIQGTGVQYYRPHYYATHKSKYSNASNMKGSFADRVIGTFVPSYYTYKDMYSRPYPIISKSKTLGPVAGEVSKLSSGVRGTDKIALGNELDNATSLNDITLKLDQQIFSMSEMAGLAGFAVQNVTGINEPTMIPEIPSPQINSFYRDYWNMNLGDIAGFCLTSDSMITTPETSIPISEIEIGTSVLTKDGNFHKVINKLVVPYSTWSQRSHIIKLETLTSSLRLTSNHYVPIVKKKDLFNNYLVTEVQAKDIEKYDYLIYPIRKDLNLSTSYPTLFNDPEISKQELVQFFGHLIRNLCSPHRHPYDSISGPTNAPKNSICIPVPLNNNTLGLEYILNIFKLNYTIINDISNISVYVHKDLRFYGMLSWLISISDYYPIPNFMWQHFSENNTLLMLFINALFSTNGIASNSLFLNNFTMFTNIFNFLLYHNIIPSCLVAPNEYAISIVSNQTTSIGYPCIIDNDTIIAMIREDYLYIAVTNIETDSTYTDSVYDLTIEDIHMYCANNIVVHNTEPIRRFIPQRSSNVEYYNPIPNAQPVWIPNSGIYRFKEGDPYTKIEMGEIRLPGPAYNMVHKVHYTTPISGFALGLTPEEQYNFYLGSPKFLNMFNQERVLSERMVNKLKESNQLFQADAVYSKQYNLDVSIEGMLSFNNMQLPLAIGYSPATYSRLNAYLVLKNMKQGIMLNPMNNDIISVTANKDQFQNDLVQSMQVVSDVRKQINKGKISPMDDLSNSYSHYDRAKILADVAPYSREFKNEFEMAKQEGIATPDQLNQLTANIEKIEEHYDFKEYKYKYNTIQELSNAGVSPFEAVIGKTWESWTHSRDMLSTKLFGFRSALETYEQNFAYGPNFQDWTNPIDSMLKPKLKSMEEERNLFNAAGIGGSIGLLFGGGQVGVAGAVTGSAFALVNNITGRTPKINQETQEVRNIDAQAITLEYIKNMKLYNETGDKLYLYRANNSLLSPHSLDADTIRRLSTKAEKPFIRQFLQYNKPQLQKRVLKALPPIMHKSMADYYEGKTTTEGITPDAFINSIPSDDWIGWNPEASMSDAELVEMDIRNKNARLILKGWDYEYRSISQKPVVALGFREGSTRLGFNMPDWW